MRLGLLLALASASPVGDEYTLRARPILARHCLECHSGPEPKGELALDLLATSEQALARPDLWILARERLALYEMPPAKAPQPSDAERAELIAWIDEQVLARAPIEPGPAPLRRLTRREIEATLEDVLGISVDAADWFQSDDVGSGFDNDADVLGVSPLFLERALALAEDAARRAIAVPGLDAPERRVIEARDLSGERGNQLDGGRWSLFSESEVGLALQIPRAGSFVVQVRAGADPAGPEPPRLSILLDGAELEGHDVLAPLSNPADHGASFQAEAGTHHLAVRFVNDYYAPDAVDPEERDRNLVVEGLELVGPLEGAEPTAFQTALLAGREPADLEEILGSLVLRLWRRPARGDELERLGALAPGDGTLGDPPLELAVREATVALLASPHFLFRPEPDPPLASGVRALDGFELATRISYLVWSSAPDPRLLQRAGSGALSEEAGLVEELARLLADARASRFARAFATQWLALGRLEDLVPSPKAFPEFDEELRAAMREETLAFFEAILRERRPLAELLGADFTFLNERLARHYGIGGVQGTALLRVPLPEHGRGSERGGLLGQASVLTSTSTPTRTSPVLRGKWILETLIGAPPPPPPPGVPPLAEEGAAGAMESVAARLERHRIDPACGACHERMDALGLALEEFDGVGRLRASMPGDAGELSIDGAPLTGAALLRSELAEDPRVLRHLAARLLAFALGRDLVPSDAPTVARLVEGLDTHSATLPLLLERLVLSPAFRTKRVSPP